MTMILSQINIWDCDIMIHPNFMGKIPVEQKNI
jgi:hypothetical protein